MESVLTRLDVLQRHLNRVAEQFSTSCQQLISMLGAVVQVLWVHLLTIPSTATQYCVQHCPTSGVGRPKYNIPEQQLVHLTESTFTVPQIADLLGVSVRTVHRRRNEYGLSISATYADLIS